MRGDGGAKIQRFRAEAGVRHGNRFFSDPEELAGLVLEAILAEINQDSPGSGDTEKARYPGYLAGNRPVLPSGGIAAWAHLPRRFKTKLRVSIDLEELYVPLQAIVDLRGSSDSIFADASDAEAKLRGQGSRDIPLIDAFQDAKKRKRRAVVILGDPGSGKTTHLKRLLLACLRQGPEGLGLPAGTLPVFLPLRELEDLSKGIDAFIEQSLDDDPHMKMSRGFCARLLDRGHLLLLFDGLDEVSAPRNAKKSPAGWNEPPGPDRPARSS